MNELTEETRVDASVEVVWRDLADAASLREWIWPPRFETATVVDPQPGGAWEVRSDVAEIAVVARVLSADPPHELCLAWCWEGEDHATDVDIVLESIADAATRVRVHHSGFETTEERDSHVEGWQDCLQRLVDRHALTGP